MGLLVLARCAGFVFRAPGFSHPSVPAPLRGGFALVLAMVIAPSLPGAQARVDGGAFVGALLVEFLLGSAIGMAASLVYDGAYAGGRIVDDYVGVKAIAPSVVLVAPSGFGRVWSLAFTGAFFLSGAYRLTLLGFAQSFARIPLLSPLHAGAWASFAAAFAANFLLIALQVAAPALGLAFVVQIALGTLSRVVPRFGTFTLAFPLAFAAALIATALVVPFAAGRVPPPMLGVPGMVK
ncbi:MAG TPA: flagellar biosynthetic protein FliR [Candidatus Cybelea sp.]|nr:flagellar biosynthetic protein FliR [Candidatus Cybelea sp.]